MRTRNRFFLFFAVMAVTFLGAQTNQFMKPMNEMMGRVKQVKLSGSFDADFAKMMFEHHQGAIDMANAYLAGGKNEEMKAHAREMIEKYKKEQKQLEIFTKAKGAGGSNDLLVSMDKMMKSMQVIKPAGDADRDFAAMMSAHHDGGIEIAQMEVTRGENAALQKMAAKLVESQRHSKHRLQQWLNSQPVKK